MSLNKTYPVHNSSGKPIVLDLGGAAVGDPGGLGSGAYPATPVFSHTPVGGKVKPLIIGIGSAHFAGNGTNLVSVAVGHGLGLVPLWVDIMPALTSTGSFWGGEYGQYRAADKTAFYVSCFSPTGLFGVGFSYFFNWRAEGALS